MPFARRPLLCLLAALVGLTAAASRGGQAVLCIAAGDDHHHVAIEARHDGCPCASFVHRHDHEPAGTHDGDPAGVVVDAAHPHACVDIRLPAGDLRSAGKPTGDVVDAVPAAPVAPLLPLVLSPRPAVLPTRYDTHPPGLAPPDLLRSTILLI